jgi:hypothetical protein
MALSPYWEATVEPLPYTLPAHPPGSLNIGLQGPASRPASHYIPLELVGGESPPHAIIEGCQALEMPHCGLGYVGQNQADRRTSLF